jgi:hypothetical protein
MFNRALQRGLLILIGLVLLNGLLIRPESTLGQVVYWLVNELRTAVANIIGWLTLLPLS